MSLKTLFKFVKIYPTRICVNLCNLCLKMKKRHQQKMIIVSMVLLMGFNLPIVLLFDSSQNLLGFPVIYIYFFSICLISILISLLIVTRYNE